MSEPIWLQSLDWYLDSTPAITAREYFSGIHFGSIYCLRWLDKNDVRGNADNESAARKMLDRIQAFAHFQHIRHPHGGLAKIIECEKRLIGLVKP